MNALVAFRHFGGAAPMIGQSYIFLVNFGSIIVYK